MTTASPTGRTGSKFGRARPDRTGRAGVWLDIGRPADYEEAQKTFAGVGARILPE